MGWWGQSITNKVSWIATVSTRKKARTEEDGAGDSLEVVLRVVRDVAKLGPVPRIGAVHQRQQQKEHRALHRQKRLGWH